MKKELLLRQNRSINNLDIDAHERDLQKAEQGNSYFLPAKLMEIAKKQGLAIIGIDPTSAEINARLIEMHPNIFRFDDEYGSGLINMANNNWNFHYKDRYVSEARNRIMAELIYKYYNSNDIDNSHNIGPLMVFTGIAHLKGINSKKMLRSRDLGYISIDMSTGKGMPK